MLVKNANIEDLAKALVIINKKYKNNIIFNRKPEYIGKRVRFTIKVKDSKKDGAKTGFTGRRTINACWHVHGDFFDLLFTINPEAIIKAGTKEITKDYGNWQDWNIGSLMDPLYYSEACKCE